MNRPQNWFDAVQHCHQTGKSYVLVTVLGTAGSTPRSSGTKMVVTSDETLDTIGGGHLEHLVTRNARALLIENKTTQKIEQMPLDSKLGQCCGGAVHVLYEVQTQHQQTLALFGAGHVAKALIPIVAQLPLQIKWIDNRDDMFPEFPETMSSNVTPILSDDPVYELKALSDNSWIVVMTHNHQLDFDLVHKALLLPNIEFVGMIGSDTKARRFKTRLQHRDLSEQQISKLTSPVGDLSVPGKRPIEVAISISAQLVQMLNTHEEASTKAVTENEFAEKKHTEKAPAKEEVRQEQKQLWTQVKQLENQLEKQQEQS